MGHYCFENVTKYDAAQCRRFCALKHMLVQKDMEFARIFEEMYKEVRNFHIHLHIVYIKIRKTPCKFHISGNFIQKDAQFLLENCGLFCTLGQL